MSLHVVYDEKKDGSLDPCGWVTPNVWKDEAKGLVFVQFCCQGCGELGGDYEIKKMQREDRTGYWGGW